MTRWTPGRITLEGTLLTATQAVDQVIFHVPTDSDMSYRFVRGRSSQGTASSSGTFRPRVIRSGSVEAPGATASATCIELADALSTASTAETPTNWTPVADVVINPGDRIAIKTAGTQTNLVAYCYTFVLEPMQNRV